MRALYVCADLGIPLDGMKGASIHVQQTLRALVEQGIEAAIVSARPGEGPPGVRVFRPISGTSAYPGDPAHTKRIGPEAARLAASRSLVEAVPFQRGDVDVVYERYSLCSLAGVVLADALRAPLFLEVNAPLVEEQRRFRGLRDEGIAERIERAVLARADVVLCVSSALVDWAARIRGSEAGVHLFPNFVDTKRFRPAADRRGHDEGFHIIFVGTLKPWHGLPFLIDALARVLEDLPLARLTLVGEGPERERLERLAVERGVRSSIRFLGAVAHDRVPDLLRGADAAVAPYPPLDNFYFSPLKIVEYLATGLPVVASACGDSLRWLRDGVSALLVPPGDPAALADALLALARSPEQRARIGSEGRRVAEEHFSRAAAGRRLRGLMEAAAATRATP